MPEKEYHVHVNAVGKIPEAIAQQLQSMGFYYSDVTTDHNHGVPERLGIFTLKTNLHQDRDRIFGEALSVIRSDSEFRGYVESESAARQLIADIAFKPFDGTDELQAMALPSATETPIDKKKADIHVYVPNEHCSTAIEDFLLSHNFYKVQGRTKTNFTLALGSMRDAKKYYATLLDFFTRHGGVSKIECEVVNNLEVANPHSRLRRVIPEAPRTWLEIGAQEREPSSPSK